MKAYLLAQESSRNAPPQPANNKSQIAVPDAALALAASLGIKAPKTIAPIQGAMDKATTAVQPQVKKYYELALSKLDELLKQEPGDMWARVYRAHLKAEYTGNLDEAMATWQQCQKDAPDNPASYFFLGEGYLKQGNLKESLSYISRAIALRAQGK
jgi:predicted Zn-dependent protease